MNRPDDSPRSPSLTFSGAAALLLLVAAFCAYPCGAYIPAVLFAGLAFVSLSLVAPDARHQPARIPVRRDETPRGPDLDPR